MIRIYYMTQIVQNNIRLEQTHQSTNYFFVWQLYFLVKTITKHINVHIIKKKQL